MRHLNVTVMDNSDFEYACEYCGKRFLPKRRRVQRFCSASCRSQAHKLRKRAREGKKEAAPVPKKKAEAVLAKEEGWRKSQVTPTGVAETMIANLATDGLKAGTKALFGLKSASERSLEEVKQKVDALYRDAVPGNLIRRTGRRVSIEVEGAGSLPFETVVHQPSRTLLYYRLGYGYLYYDEVAEAFKRLPFDPAELKGG